MNKIIFYIFIIVFFVKTGNVFSSNNIFDVDNIVVKNTANQNKEKLLDKAFQEGFKKRTKKISINNNNKNDILKIFGHPHYISVNDENTWVYFERILSKGKYHKLGKHTLKENNTLVLKFDKFGVLKTKNFFNKDDIKKLKFSKMETENKLTKKSFIEGFLQSVKQKMYGSKK